MDSYQIADLVEAVADTVPDRVALVCGDDRLTYRELDERATKLAGFLRDRGIGRGDHIGTYLYNGTEYVTTMLAAFKISAVPINVNYRYVEGGARLPVPERGSEGVSSTAASSPTASRT